jgi:hypothetical protein
MTSVADSIGIRSLWCQSDEVRRASRPSRFADRDGVRWELCVG